MCNDKGLISVVMPVYNGALYLRQTVHSILSQSYSNFELLIIDDGSNDDSLAILKELERSDPRIHVFQKENGGTVPKAINHILDSVKGQFYFYLSQDDLISDNLFEILVSRYIETGADVVLPDLIFMYDNEPEKNIKIIGCNGDRNVVLTGRQAVVNTLNWQIHGFGLWNSQLIKGLRYEEFALNSDEYSTRVFFFNCNKVVFSEGVFFYRQRPNTITKKLTPRIFDFAETNRRLYIFLEENNFGQEILDRQLAINATQLVVSTRKFLHNKHTFSAVDNSNIKDILALAFKDIDYYRLIAISGKKGFSKLILIYYSFRSFNFFVFCCNVQNAIVRLLKHGYRK